MYELEYEFDLALTKMNTDETYEELIKSIEITYKNNSNET